MKVFLERLPEKTGGGLANRPFQEEAAPVVAAATVAGGEADGGGVPVVPGEGGDVAMQE